MSNEIIKSFEVFDETAATPSQTELQEVMSISRGLMLILALVNPERLVRGGTPQEASDLRRAITYVRNMAAVRNTSQYSKIQFSHDNS